METIAAVHHLSLTVRDLDRSVRWYSELFDLVTAMDEQHEGGHAVVLVQPDTHVFVGLHVHDATGPQEFTESVVGLDHIAFAVADRPSLEKWLLRLDERGIPHSQIKDRDYGSILTLRDPDNIQLELYAPPPA